MCIRAFLIVKRRNQLSLRGPPSRISSALRSTCEGIGQRIVCIPAGSVSDRIIHPSWPHSDACSTHCFIHRRRARRGAARDSATVGTPHARCPGRAAARRGASDRARSGHLANRSRQAMSASSSRRSIVGLAALERASGSPRPRPGARRKLRERTTRRCAATDHWLAMGRGKRAAAVRPVVTISFRPGSAEPMPQHMGVWIVRY